MSGLQRITFKRHPVATHRRHYVSEDDVRVVLSRLPVSLLSRLKEVHFSDEARGNRRLGYTSTRGRRHVTLCALPIRVSLRRFRNARPTENFGAIDGSQWPVLAVRRYMLYDVLLHEIAHLQIVLAKSKNFRRKYAGEGIAYEFAVTWRKKLWAVHFDHPDPVHNAPSEEELSALRKGWAAAHLHYKSGLNLEEAGDRRMAAKSYEKALSLYPDHALALERLGVMTYAGYSEHGDSPPWEKVIGMFRRALAQDPMLCDATLYLGMTLHELDQRDAAREMFERAISIDPYVDLAKTVYAEHLGYWGEFDAAEDLFERILKKGPKSGLALRDYASMLMFRSKEINEEDTRRAIALLDTARGLGFKHSCHYLLGVAHSWLGNMQDAVEHMRETVRLRPGYKDAEELLREWESELE